jgi:hypothetical protein
MYISHVYTLSHIAILTKDFQGTNSLPMHGDVAPRQLVMLPAIVADDQLVKKNKNGTMDRVKRRGLDQRLVLAAEEPNDIPRPNLSQIDNKNETFEDFITDYVTKWRPLETLHGNVWRVDKPVECIYDDGEIETRQQKTRAMWWSRRKPMYIYFEHQLESNKSVSDILQLGSIIYESACVVGKAQRRPQLEHVQKKFGEELKTMGLWTGKRGSGALELLISDKNPEMPNKRARTEIEHNNIADNEQVHHTPALPATLAHQIDLNNPFDAAFAEFPPFDNEM